MIRSAAFNCEIHALGGKIFGCYPYLACLVPEGLMETNHHSAACGNFVFMVLRDESRSGYHSLSGMETIKLFHSEQKDCCMIEYTPE
jgi:hypothetical protein